MRAWAFSGTGSLRERTKIVIVRPGSSPVLMLTTLLCRHDLMLVSGQTMGQRTATTAGGMEWSRIKFEGQVSHFTLKGCEKLNSSMLTCKNKLAIVPRGPIKERRVVS